MSLTTEDFSSGLQGAAQGAAAGTMIAPGIGTVIGGIAGGLESLFNSPDAQRRKRYAQLLSEIQQYRKQALQEGTGIINQQTSDQTAMARAAGARRAAASGRYGDATSFSAPEVGRIEDVGSQNLRRYTMDVNRQTGNAIMNAAGEYANRPIQPSLGDTLLAAGQAYSGMQNANKMRDIEAGRVKSYQDYINAYTKSLENPTDVQPSAPTGEIPMNQGSDGTYYPSLRTYGRRLTFGNPSNSWMANY